jgi:hypothetical protein
MNKKEQRLRDEISYLLNDQESDRDYYKFVTSNFLGIIAIIISVFLGLINIILNFRIETFLLSIIKGIIILIVAIIIVSVFLNNRQKSFNKSRKNYSENINKKRKLIEEKYNKIYGLEKGFKEKLEEDLKKFKTTLLISSES